MDDKPNALQRFAALPPVTKTETGLWKVYGLIVAALVVLAAMNYLGFLGK